MCLPWLPIWAGIHEAVNKHSTWLCFIYPSILWSLTPSWGSKVSDSDCQNPPDCCRSHWWPLHRRHHGPDVRRLRSAQKHQEEESTEKVPGDWGEPGLPLTACLEGNEGCPAPILEMFSSSLTCRSPSAYLCRLNWWKEQSCFKVLVFCTAVDSWLLKTRKSSLWSLEGVSHQIFQLPSCSSLNFCSSSSVHLPALMVNYYRVSFWPCLGWLLRLD